MSVDVSGRRQLALRVTFVASAVATSDVLARSLVTANFEPHQRVPLWAGVVVVDQQQRSGLMTPSTIAAFGAMILILFASRYGVVRRTLWLPVGLLLGAGIANAADVLSDGRITRWLDPPLWAALGWSDIALAGGLLGLVYALGEALGGAETERRGRRPAT